MQKPTQKIELFDGAATVLGYGVEYTSMVPRGKTPEAAEESNPGCLEKLTRIFKANECAAYAPVPAFNARIARTTDLTSEWVENHLFRGDATNTSRLADGLVLDKSGQAYALFSADCTLVVLYGKKTGLVLTLHCGRDAMLDRALIRGDEGREHESVIYTGLNLLHSAGEETKDVQAHIGLGIGPVGFEHRADHPKYGAGNRQMVDYAVENFGSKAAEGDLDLGQLNLTQIALAQLTKRGVAESQITHDNVDTFLDKDENGEFVWFSNRRNRTDRNLVLVRRNR